MAAKPKPKRPAVKMISEDEMEERKRKALDEDEDDDDDEDDDEDDDTDVDDLQDVDEAPAPRGRRLQVPDMAPNENIFDWVEQEYIKKGVPVVFVVHRNGTLVGELQYPLSWDSLQSEWGGGLYVVRAKNNNTKKFIKVQTMQIASPRAKPEKEEPKIVERYETHEPPEPKMDILQIMELMRGVQSEAGDKVREAQRDARDSQTTLMAAMMQMMSQSAKPVQSSDDKIMALMMQMQQNTNQMFEKVMIMTRESIAEVSKTSEKIFEKLSQRIEDLSKNTGKSSGLEYTPQQIMEMMNQGQQRGFEMWAHMEKLADMKASQRFEIMEATKSEAVEETKPKSMTEKLVDSMLPMVSTIIQSQVAAQAAAQASRPQPRPQPQRQALPPAPRGLPSVAKPPAAPSKPRPVAQAVAKPRAAAQAPAKPAAPAPVVPEVLEAETTTDPFGFPSAKPTQPAQEEAATTTHAEEAFDEEKFATYMNHASVSLMECWNAKKPIPDTASHLLSSLQAQGIEAQEFLEACPRAKVEETLKAFGADETIMNFVGETYAYLEAGAAMGTRR